MNNNDTAIECQGISKAFTVGHVTQQVIKDCSLTVAAGEFTLIVGPSGSGKSTLLSMLSGLLHPDSGRVRALETDLWSLREAGLDNFRLRHCGFIFQGFNLFSSLTALDNVILAVQYQGVRAAEARERAVAALEEVGLAERAHLRPVELSGGEKQRVAIARALVKAPLLVFADEPTSALDGKNGHVVVDLLQRMVREHGTTVLGVTHDPRVIGRADRVIHLEDGRVVKDQRPTNHHPATQEHELT
jgi:putative ABC transport system ATP-binding protein